MLLVLVMLKMLVMLPLLDLLLLLLLLELRLELDKFFKEHGVLLLGVVEHQL